MAVKPIPEGFYTVTPYLVTSNADGVLDFVVRAFDSMLMVADGSEKCESQPVSLYLYVADTDAFYRRGLEAGGTSLMEPADQFYGDRNAGVQDLAGNRWWIATHVA